MIALILFTIALYRINRIGKDFEAAFKNRDYTMMHFGCVILILALNIINLIDLSLELAYSDSCSKGLNIAYFTFAVGKWIWDIG